MSEIAKSINSREVEAVNIVYFPQLGFLITLPIPEMVPIQRPSEMNLVSNFNSKVIKFVTLKMIKCSTLKDNILYYYFFLDLDETIGDVYADIIDAQLEILQQIVNEAVK